MKALLLLAVGSILLILTATGNATYPMWGYGVGGILVLISVCVLARKWPAKPVERDESDEAGA